MKGKQQMIRNFVEYCLHFPKSHLDEMRYIRSYTSFDSLGAYVLTAEQKAEIDDYYLSHLGRKVPYDWHSLIYGATGVFDKRYMPDYVGKAEFEWLVNPPDYCEVLKDKNLLSLIASGIEDMSVPQTLLACSAGHFCDGEDRTVSRAEALSLMSELGGVFIKPTAGSCSGNGCLLAELEHGVDQRSGKSCAEIVDGYSGNFAVQSRIVNHERVAALHPNSINTFRIVSYFNPAGEHRLAPTYMRIGINGRPVDNIHAGNIFIGVDDDFRLNEFALSRAGVKYSEHPDTHIVFKGYHIPQVRLAREKAAQLHMRIPQVGTIGFDFTIGADGAPVLVEMNIGDVGGIYTQLACGKPIYGEDTDAILEFLRYSRKLYPFKFR